ncbi:MAG: citrate/2-methylcitrate synthase [Clostridia bacterium]|nr:citrate/2-methylcitrate synthase [Clostridia bacterium]
MDINYILELGVKAEENNKIKPSLYSKYDVKRGLRNENGTGVLVGLTEIGGVKGYIMDDNERIPAEGTLHYRGIDINDLVNGFLSEDRFGFEECTYLLLFGSLPDKDELKRFTQLICDNRGLPNAFLEDMILKAPSKDIMNKLARSILVLYSYDDNPDDISVVNILKQSVEIVAKFTALMAYGYQAKSYHYLNRSLVIHTPDKTISTAENILKMTRASGQYTDKEAKLLDLCLVLHAEHGGGNNSTFATHVVASSGTDIYSCISSAIGSLKGPRHGGANIKVNNMMKEIKANINDFHDEAEIEKYIEKILNREAFDRTGLVYGIGHAVYTLSDPRAILLKEKARELASENGFIEEFELYEKVELLTPKVFARVKNSDKAIAANVDFYSGFVYNMLGIDEDLFTPLFATARVSGWCAHIIEEIINGGRIIRPAYKNVIEQTDYIPIAER